VVSQGALCAQRMKITVTMASEERRSDYVGVIGIMTEESTKTILSNGLATSVAIIRYQSRESTASYLATLKGTRCGWLLMMLDRNFGKQCGTGSMKALPESRNGISARGHWLNKLVHARIPTQYPHMAVKRTGIRSPRC
jgi:hypothetical protein